RDPEGVMAVLPADHFVAEGEEFRRVLLAAAQVAEEGHLVTLGIEPDRPATGYGYVCRGEFLTRIDGYDVYEVEKFTEKPDLATAQRFLRSRRCYWNSGIFVWKVLTILGKIEKLMPAFYSQLMEIEQALGTPEEETLERIWAQVEDETIDYGVMEHAEDVAVIPADIGWSDVGDWAALYELLSLDGEGNVIVGEHVGLDTKGCLVHSPRLVATIGLEDMIIVDADDVVLICPKDRAQDVRRLVDKLKEMDEEEHL
ncbi:MAG: sugar phosphate nucleotidyltransferase, partial [Chloroflexota bacterium]|nr:sugar phosphate nucleotidyltransferase [Chloroflexota bacterium]